ncbi:MAG: hypothetical protein IPG67_14920 [Acidobacteria bacterium]|nr:hypothetical protein [Acidobacteriota bacterium]
MAPPAGVDRLDGVAVVDDDGDVLCRFDIAAKKVALRGELVDVIPKILAFSRCDARPHIIIY